MNMKYYMNTMNDYMKTMNDYMKTMNMGRMSLVLCLCLLEKFGW